MRSTLFPQSAIIIGAGIGGLATANLLAKAGVKVTVFERHAQAGGRAGTFTVEGFRFDSGPSWYLMPEVFERYYHLLGERVSKHLDLVALSPAYKVFFEHQPNVTIHANLEEDVHTFDEIEPGAGAALRSYLATSKETYEAAIAHFLYNNFHPGTWAASPALLKLLPRMIKLMTTSLHHHVDSYVRDTRLQQILEYSMVFLGTSPYAAPAIYNLMSHMDFNQGVWYPQGGMYKIIESLQGVGQKLGVTYHYDAPVAAINVAGDRATGITLRSGETHTADAVISNADLKFTETVLLPEAAQMYPQAYWDAHQPSASALLMYLGVKGTLPQLTHHNLLFVESWKRNFDDIYDTKTWPEPASMYVCRPGATDPSVAPVGHENLFVLVPLPAAVVPGAEVAPRADQYLRQLAGMIGVPDLADRITVKKLFGPQDFVDTFEAWEGTALGMSHVLGQSAMFRPANRSRKLANLFYVGAGTVPGIGLPMCLISAELVYKRIMGDRSVGPDLRPIRQDLDEASPPQADPMPANPPADPAPADDAPATPATPPSPSQTESRVS